MSVPEARKDPVLRRWPLRRRRVPSAAGTLSFVVPTSSDAVLDRLGDHADPEDLPYWADVWASSLALARGLVREGSDLAGWTAVDLGCGVGVAGVGAGLCGADVAFLDSWADAVHFARFNAVHNGIDRARVLAAPFDWSRDRLDDLPFPNPRDPGRTVLLMADLFYEARHHAPIDRLTDAVLAGGGAVVAADPCREAADPWFERLAARAPAARLERIETHDGRGRVTVRVLRAGAPLPHAGADRPGGEG